MDAQAGMSWPSGRRACRHPVAVDAQAGTSWLSSRRACRHPCGDPLEFSCRGDAVEFEESSSPPTPVLRALAGIDGQLAGAGAT